MEVWLVIYNNEGEYEEYEEWVEAVMSSEEKAKNYQPNGKCLGIFDRIECFTLDEPSNWKLDII